METLEDALERGCLIEREVRFFATDRAGRRYLLRHDCMAEIVDDYIEMMKKEHKNGQTR